MLKKIRKESIEIFLFSKLSSTCNQKQQMTINSENRHRGAQTKAKNVLEPNLTCCNSKFQLKSLDLFVLQVRNKIFISYAVE